MLSGFKDNADDQSGWLVGLALWTCGAAAGLLVATVSNAPALSQFEVLLIAFYVSAISICLQLPILLCDRPFPTSLGHALWLLGAFAQLNWSGFLAMRASNGLVAAEAICICLVSEVWLARVLTKHGKLTWLEALKQAWLREFTAPLDVSAQYSRTGQVEAEPEIHCSETTSMEEPTGLQRVTRDAIDAQGERYLTGAVRFEMAANQRSETIVINFYPPLERLAQIELETDSEDLTARTENSTQTGARIVVRRQKAVTAGSYSLEWCARSSSSMESEKLFVLP